MAAGLSLRCGLLGLLLFTLVCLVILECSLHDTNFSFVKYNALNSTDSRTVVNIPDFVATIDASRTATGTRSNKTFVNTSLSLTALSDDKTTNGSLDSSHNSSFVTLLGTSTTPSRTTSQNGKSALTTLISSFSSTPSSPSSVDYCKEREKQRIVDSRLTDNRTFSLDSQMLADGSRPVDCSQCFHSRFPPLLQSCDVCSVGEGREEVVVVMVILTTHGAADKRQAIRDTWVSYTRKNTAHVRHVFLLGRSKNEADTTLVEKEHAQYGDLIMHDYVDTYANLTLKTLTALHWVVDFCYHARFILKADDDMWINVPALLDTVKNEETTLNTSIGGSCAMKAGPIRNPRSKWYASQKAYPQSSYPGFCSGTAYVTSVNVARHILSVSPNVPFFYLEDVYLALCIRKLGSPFHLQKLKGFVHGQGNPCVLRRGETISVHEVKPEKLRNIWNANC